MLCIRHRKQQKHQQNSGPGKLHFSSISIEPREGKKAAVLRTIDDI